LPWRIKKANLVLASWGFYASWYPPFLILLIVSTVVDFFLARWLARTQAPALRRLILVAGLGLSLGLLVYFKYGTFLLENWLWVLHLGGMGSTVPAVEILLPLGLSFYTFESVSYLVDVYSRRIEACSSLLDYALFLSFFPHLVAGPIVRAGDFLPQCRAPRQANRRRLGWGLCLMVIGLFEKVVLADGFLAPVAESVFFPGADVGCLGAWLGCLAFSGQIFCDFAGYSTCGIGCALCFGFVLRDNFRFPFGSVGLQDFWQRWHISLSEWFRDYLYLPLGGSRQGLGRTRLNLMVTMVVSGLWHGAAWRFVIWGGANALLMMAERTLRKLLERFAWTARLDTGLGRWVLSLLTWAVRLAPLVFFRAIDLRHATRLLKVMFRPTSLGIPVASDLALAAACILLGLFVGHRLLHDSSLERVVSRIPWWARAGALAFLLIALVLAPGEHRAFIYFHF
jgi:alginate O-acetyltransferase complex protein AlgI